MRIIFIDECSFSAFFVLTKRYSHKYQNFAFLVVKKHPQILYIVAGVSKEYGLEGYIFSDDPINSKSYLSILAQFTKYEDDYTLL